MMTDEKLLSKIKFIIEEMRPNAQMDGSDILFDHFKNGTVYVRLEGVCASSIITFNALKENIQERLTQDISEVHEVIAIK